MDGDVHATIENRDLCMSKSLDQTVVLPRRVDIVETPTEATLAALESLINPSTQTAAAQQARIRDALDAIATRVPEERRVPSLPSIAVPVLARLKYTEDASPQKAMYINVLTRSVDRETHADVHPAFITLIEQLCSDEAVLMFLLQRQDISMTKRNPAFGHAKQASASFYLPNIAPDVDAADVPKGMVKHPHHMKMYLSHLLSLNLIKIKPPAKADGATEWLTWTVCPSDFGALFVATCVAG